MVIINIRYSILNFIKNYHKYYKFNSIDDQNKLEKFEVNPDGTIFTAKNEEQFLSA